MMKSPDERDAFLTMGGGGILDLYEERVPDRAVAMLNGAEIAEAESVKDGGSMR